MRSYFSISETALFSLKVPRFRPLVLLIRIVLRWRCVWSNWQGKHYIAWGVDEWMGMERWWNGTDRGRRKYWERNIIYCGWQVNEWVWSIDGMILTGENWSTGRETLYSVGGSWMKGYGALVEWYWQGKTEVLGENLVTLPLCPSHVSHGLI